MSNKQRFVQHKDAIDAAITAGMYRNDIAKQVGITDMYMIYNYILAKHGADHPSMTRNGKQEPTTVLRSQAVYTHGAVSLGQTVCAKLLLHLTPRQIAAAYGFPLRDFCAWVIQHKLAKTWLLPNRKAVGAAEALERIEEILGT